MTWPVTLVDAGPLVAALSPRDEHHRWVVEQMAHLEPGVTCEAALTEAAFLVGRDGVDPTRVLAERLPEARVFTLDTDFQVYRMHGRRRIPLLAPFA